MQNARRTAVLFALLLASSPARAGDDFKAMAKEISRAAKKAGMERVAVLAFVPADGSSSSDGWNISEKMTTQVVRTGLVQTVERSLLKKLMEEHHLGQTGILDQSTLKKLAKVFSVEGLITGSFVTMGPDVIIQARLINIETGVIVMASEGRVTREWSASAAPVGAPKPESSTIWVPAPEFTVAAPAFDENEQASIRDSVSDNPAGDDSCANAAQRMDGMNRKIMDLKARYWALQLKHGLPLSGLRHNPGSEISDPELKKEFYGRTKAWVLQGDIPELTASEVKRFVDVGSKVFDLAARCGI